MNYTRVFALLTGLVLLAAACGGDDSETATAAEPTTTTAVAADDDAIEDDQAEEEPVEDVEAEPEFVSAIISLSPTATEMLFAIGAGDQMLAVDDLSSFPEAAVAKMQGLSAFQPNVEAIASLEPDLVITDGTNPDFLSQLDALGITHWEGPAAIDFSDIYDQIEQLGAATGKVGEAAELVASMSARVEAVTSTITTPEVPLTYYHELDPTFYSVSPGSFIGSVYTLAGLQNIVADDAGAYPQLSQEFIVDANPDLIFLACTIYCGETAESVAARDGWADLAAVQAGNVIEMNDDVASRWGPRTVDYLEQVAAAVNSLTAAAN
jgi:iron complex transport system substrate-binding protein